MGLGSQRMMLKPVSCRSLYRESLTVLQSCLQVCMLGLWHLALCRAQHVHEIVVCTPSVMRPRHG